LAWNLRVVGSLVVKSGLPRSGCWGSLLALFSVANSWGMRCILVMEGAVRFPLPLSRLLPLGLSFFIFRCGIQQMGDVR
jgi:hypothetical protein